ncbi:SUKH-4 family immunity protein [Micromonospora sp. NPDC049559]|uniref:SUKH-4 family immunity protein n=1 Tax=Micromonospora sp. NPDC049559 TaxID=3155923 RepID=UPI0034480694
MPTHQDMVELYGAENVVTVPRSVVDGLSLGPADAETLAAVGLPRYGSPYFTTEVVGGPEFLRVIDVTRKDGRPHREVIIGGPPGDAGMRFSLSAYEGFVTLAELSAVEPRGEVVNNNLAEFVEFLYLIERHRVRVAGDPGIREKSLDELRNTLVGIDPFSFELAEDWWSIALHQLGGGDIAP